MMWKLWSVAPRLDAAISVFLVWHTLALVIAPAPNGSAIAQTLRPLLQPYLTLFRLDNQWDFYAPEVGNGLQFRYEIEDASGLRRSFTPTDGLSWYHPDYWWFREWYDAVMYFPETYADYFVTLLCRKHADLKANSTRCKAAEVTGFTPEDHLNGKRPLDSDLVNVTTLKQAPCPQP